MTYLDHTHLTGVDYAAFEQLLAAQHDSRPYPDSDWQLVLSETEQTARHWASTLAIFRPGAFNTAPQDHEVYVQVYFDERGRALPDRPDQPIPDSPLGTELTEHLPGWSIQP
ncbi:hypothetical protein [Kitasatospora sp. LaBMicrA B282]|uniref:hypothetical protein n=1 Tax=Kitasatospora sp. LaBMicrA B282 TaxID=3420949 RepID=UPI003D0BCA3A